MRKHIHLICFVFLYLVILLLSMFFYNVHAVIPGKIYRSNQLTETQFENFIHQKGIRSIINMRGRNLNQPWYQKEMLAVQQTHVHHFDVTTSSKKLPPKIILQQLVNVLIKAPRPILIHCRAGADRTGMASAVALILNTDDSMTTIEKQASYRYFALSPISVGKLLLDKYQHWLTQNKLTTSKQNFLKFVNQYQ